MIRFLPSVLAASLLILYLSSSVEGNTINSTVQHLYKEIGDTVTLTCTYSTTSTNLYLFWYRQYAHHIQYILVHGAKSNSYFKNNNTELEPGKFQSETSDNHTTLTIHRMSVSDSAVYLCALSDGGNYGKMVFGSGTKLVIKPGTEQTIPSVYKLKSTSSDEKLPNSVCLITDFPSPNKALEIDGNQVNLTDVAVLDASSDNKWRYSTVTWDNNKNACNGKYDEKDFFAENEPENNEETCSSISIDESFRTNPSLNTLSTTVFGWRVVAVKAIVFNLILSLRLWSS